ncbi:aldehyde dehydrogenase PuuC [Nocardioides aromaticivorans]|uniref:Aldehyde dehydrogenase PuuC n=1 Tax=Nocardioides aromaticivorans TaxID=200618 RepID=A0ABX7PGH5_9ACTN|nr:aldehyde dehydrogenase family protein [Nocardioides aromaticivorans]QSR24870.1 aldehyde dehydrogenase PuuC [Nocardioides aromaticivorans]
MSTQTAGPRTDLRDWLDLTNAISLPPGMWVDGEWSPARSGRTTDLVTPRDESVLAQVPSGDEHDVDRAVRGARAAFEARVWSGLEPRERGAALIRWADLLDLHRDELAVLLALEMGKPVLVARDIEMRTAINAIRWYGELADKLMDESPRGRPHALAVVTREPVGVVGAITPWNFPMTLAMFKIPAALVSGNSVVVKPATQTPLSLLRSAELACQAGIPAGVLQVLTGSGSGVGAPLALHHDVATLTFTGSSAVGKQLLVYAGQSNAKPVWLELGGKSPNIVFPDAEDLDQAARTAAWAISFNSGQMCTAGSRLVVHRDIRDEVVARVIAHLDTHVVGDPLDPGTTLGPLAYRQHREEVLAEVASGVAAGATLRHGSARGRDEGLFVDPVVFTDVDPASRLAQHEIFGPVLSVLTFEDEAEAIAIANDSDYGLGSAIWTSDLKRAHRLAREIQAGMVWVNCYEEGDTSVPFGGQKLSGHGSDRSEHGLDKFTTLKTTWIDLA